MHLRIFAIHILSHARKRRLCQLARWMMLYSEIYLLTYDKMDNIIYNASYPITLRSLIPVDTLYHLQHHGSRHTVLLAQIQ